MKTLMNTAEIPKLQMLLKYVFVIVPIVAGLDKFTNILVSWESYLAPATLDLLPPVRPALCLQTLHRRAG